MPRRRPARVAVALGALLAGCVALGAAAQTTTPTPTLPSLLRPDVDGDRRDPRASGDQDAPAPAVPGAIRYRAGRPNAASGGSPVHGCPSPRRETPRDRASCRSSKCRNSAIAPAAGAGASRLCLDQRPQGARPGRPKRGPRRQGPRPGRGPLEFRFRPIPTLTPDPARTPPALRIRNSPQSDAERIVSRRSRSAARSDSPDILLALPPRRAGPVRADRHPRRRLHPQAGDRADRRV